MAADEGRAALLARLAEAERRSAALGAVNAALGLEMASMDAEVAEARASMDDLKERERVLKERLRHLHDEPRADIAERERDVLRAERATLVYDLHMPGAPRSLAMVLPLARLIRTLLRLAGRTLERPAVPPGVPVPPRAEGEDPAVLARSLETALTALALRDGGRSPGG